MSSRITARWLIAILFIIPGSLWCQSPRKILIEEFTNASSPEAARQDSIYRAYITNPALLKYVVPINFHAGFPGRDAFYEMDSAMTRERVAFYSVDKIPSIRVNGAIPPPTGLNTPGNPSDTAAISNAVQSARTSTSPITIHVGSHLSATELFGTITVSSTSALSGARLYIVPVETAPYKFNAGETESGQFTFVPHAMQPRAISLAAGESKEFSVEIPIDAGWERAGLFIAAFVQDTTTREVLQAEDDIAMTDITFDTPWDPIDAQIEPVEHRASISATQSGEYTFQFLTSLPAGWSYTATIDGRTLSTFDSVALESNVPKVVHLTIIPNATSANRAGSVGFIMSGKRGFSTLISSTLFSGRIESLLLRRDFSRENTMEEWTKAMDNVGRPYAVLDPSQERLFNLSKYVSILVMGQSGLSPSDVGMLENTIDAGGRVLISGAEVAYGLADPTLLPSEEIARDTVFLHNYLHANYVADDAGSDGVVGVTGDPVGDNLAMPINDGVPNNTTPDWIEPRGAAVPIFNYSNDQHRVAGIRYEGDGNRFIYLAFGAEGIGNTQLRSTLLRKSIEWLTGTASEVLLLADATASIGAPWPNPATATLSIPITLAYPTTAAIALYDVRGARVADVTGHMLEPGTSVVRLDCGNLPAGSYRAVVRIGPQTQTAMVSIVR